MRIFLVVLGLSLALSGCANTGSVEGNPSQSPSESLSPTPSSSQVTFDIEITTDLAEFQPALQGYLSGLMSIGKLETKVMSDFSKAYSEGFTLNQKLTTTSKSIAEDAIKFTEDLIALEVSTPEIEYFQSEYIRIWEVKRDIMVELSEAIEAENVSLVETLLLEFQSIQSHIRPLRILLDKFMSYANIGESDN